MTERKLQRNRRGFTLTEVLLALAILIILLALAMIPISRHQRNIRQTELDSKAETIYLAAQNRLSQLQASGRSDEYGKDRATALNNIPWDAEQDKYTTSTLYYVTSAAKSTDTSAAGSILPREQVEAELWDANWVIEYDPGSGSVYAVFYSEKPMQYSFDAFNPPALTGSPGTGGGYRGLLRRRQRPERGHRQADPQDGDHQQGASAAEGHL